MEARSKKLSGSRRASPAIKGSRLSVKEKEEEETRRTKSPLIKQRRFDDDEDTEEEQETVEEDEAAKAEAKEVAEREQERRARPTWIGEANVTVLSEHRDAVSIEVQPFLARLLTFRSLASLGIPRIMTSSRLDRRTVPLVCGTSSRNLSASLVGSSRQGNRFLSTSSRSSRTKRPSLPYAGTLTGQFWPPVS
jgi:hypothetical protein